MNKIKNYILDKELIIKILFCLLLINPILDLYWLFDDKLINMFIFSPSTIIRVLLVFIMFILFLFIIPKNKMTKWYFIYVGLIIIYTIMHHINAVNFTNFYPGGLDYNLLEEIFYIIRMLLPLCIIVIASHYNIDDKKAGTIIGIITLVVCASITILNLFTISKASYSNLLIEGNILCWFKSGNCGLTFEELASRGYFMSANAISALMITITSLNIYYLIKNKSIFNYIVLPFNAIGMFLIGTKVATLGFLINIFLGIIIYLMYVIIYKKIKFEKKIFFYLLSLFIVYTLILPKSAIFMRSSIDKDLYEKRLETIKRMEIVLKSEDDAIINYTIDNKYEDYLKIENKEDIKSYLDIYTNSELNDLLGGFILENYKDFFISDDFILYHYPYKNDIEMWYLFFHEDYESRIDYRHLETTFLERIKEVNNNKLDDYLGITFVRQGNVFTLEKDFVSQYYTMGIIGVILLMGPFILIVIACIIKMLKDIKNISMKSVFTLLSVGLCLFAGFYSGNVMDALLVSYTLAFVCSILINETFNLNNVLGGKNGK